MDSDISAKISNVILIRASLVSLTQKSYKHTDQNIRKLKMYNVDFRVTGQISRAHSKKK